MVGAGSLRGAYVFLLGRRGGTAPSFNTDLFGPAHAGVNYGFIALGMSGGSILSYIGAQALPLAARHWLAGICAAAGLICVSLVKPVENG